MEFKGRRSFYGAGPSRKEGSRAGLRVGLTSSSLLSSNYGVRGTVMGTFEGG